MQAAADVLTGERPVSASGCDYCQFALAYQGLATSASEEPEEHEGNGREPDGGLLYEFAEFDFLRLALAVVRHSSSAFLPVSSSLGLGLNTASSAQMDMNMATSSKSLP